MDELEKQMRGEKDEHDIVVEEYEKALRSQMLKQMSEFKKMKETRINVEDITMEEARPISTEEMMERLSKARKKSNTNNVTYFEGNGEDGNKFLQMSTVTNEQAIKDTSALSPEEFSKLKQDALYTDMFKEKDNTEKEYLDQQKN